MVSVNSSISSAAALSSLRNISKLMEQSQNRIATGLKVASASDNAAIWATATKLRSESAANSTLKSAMSTAQGQAEGTAAVLDQIAEVLGKMKETLALGYNSAADYSGIDSQIAGYQSQIKTLVSGANINGENWLNAVVGKDVTVSVSGSDATNVTFTQATAFNADTDYAAAIATMATTNATTAGSNIDLVDAALKKVTAYAVKVGAFSDSLDTMKSLQDTVDGIRQKAIGELVDADMEKESARVTALQVQQQLAYQALAIGNSSAQNVLRLFQ
ncbi:flagellin [Aureimonas sp. AU4]|uniref:flagellin N-terminal helical domain-containing protein n=1 Tax=Aureimonas sp. AU4 TaxID=1638163 RepID=UPI000782E55A|nr:flagellin [Aureimonas sp. AU4]